MSADYVLLIPLNRPCGEKRKGLDLFVHRRTNSVLFLERHTSTEFHWEVRRTKLWFPVILPVEKSWTQISC